MVHPFLVPNISFSLFVVSPTLQIPHLVECLFTSSFTSDDGGGGWTDSFLGTGAWRQRCRADLTPSKSLSSSSSRWFSGWHGWLWCVGVWIGACVFMRLFNKRRWMLNSLGRNHHQLSKHGPRYLQHVPGSFEQCCLSCGWRGIQEVVWSFFVIQGFVSC